MSWFTEIAGKAEDLLNRVDQTAATALQNKSKSSAFYDTNIHAAKLGSNNTHFVSSYGNCSAYPVPPRTSATSIRGSFTDSKPLCSPGVLTPGKKPESDDEKLLRFLNCNETLPTPSRKSSSNSYLSADKKESQISASSSDEISQVVEMALKLDESNGIIDHTNADTSDFQTSDISQSSGSATVENFLTEVKEIRNMEPASLTVTNSEVNNVTLREEFLQAKERTEHAEAEMKRMQKKLDLWNSQISGNDKLVRELKDRENDLVTALDAKDSQLAILKVRIQEADQGLKSKMNIVNDLKAENERIIKDHADGAIFQNKTVESIRDQLHQAESELSKTKEALHFAQTEHMQRLSNMEEEHRHLSESYTTLQKKWSDVNERNKDLTSQLKSSNGNFDTIHQEYNDYKQKAQRILQSKERLITSLKEGNFDADKIEKNEASSSLLSAEVEGVKQERDLIRDELRRANELVETYRVEIQEVEKIAQNDLSASQEQSRVLKEQLEVEKVQKEEHQLLNNQLKEELQFLRDDLSRTKANLQSRLQDREIEIEKLRRQLTAKSLSSVSQDELESRLHSLTENLIQKQTVVEALSTEKNSIVLQMERLEQQLKDAQHFGSQHHTFIGVNNNESEQKPKPVYLESPFDSSLTRRVKKVYSCIDAFSIRLGVFFRRYPITRVFVIVYMLLLHLWVMIVLLTYEPEVHNSSYESVRKH